jgi:predicted metal-dependent hydrolase
MPFLIHNNQQIFYVLKRSAKAKRLRITVHSDASVVVTAPKRMFEFTINHFVNQKSDWIGERVAYRAIHPAPIFQKKLTRKDYLKHKEDARKLVNEKIEQFNGFYQFAYNRISIKDTKSRWGSCSAKKNLNFNYKIVLLPLPMAEYIVVHELCHLKEFNHSQRFWYLVGETIPEYKKIRAELKIKGIELS